MTNNKGFTLIETLVAVMLLATALAGPLTVATKSLSVAQVAKDQLTAFFLVQDAMEYVRFARDTNRLAGGDWLAGGGSVGISLSPCTTAVSATGCFLDSTNQSPTAPNACPSPNGCIAMPLSVSTFTTSSKFLQIANNQFTYNAVGTTKTIYARSVIISGSGANERTITVMVAWTDIAGVVHSVSATENIFNWQQ